MDMSLEQRRHVVVGAGGFIGTAMMKLLLNKGLPTLAIVRPHHAHQLAVIFKDVILSCAEDVNWAEVLKPGDIIHYYVWTSVPGSANVDPAHDLIVNIAPLIRLLEAVRRVQGVTVLFTSSGGTVYGRLQCVPVPESHPLIPITAYGAGKAAAELYLKFYRQLYGVDCRIARLANPYGPGQNIAKGQGAVAVFVDQISHRRPLHVWGDGGTIRDYVYVDDAVRGLLALAQLDRNATPFIFNLGSGRGLSINSLIDHLKLRVEWPVEVRYEPARSFDVPTSVLDITLARTELGWSPEIDFCEGLSRMLELMPASP